MVESHGFKIISGFKGVGGGLEEAIIAALLGGRPNKYCENVEIYKKRWSGLSGEEERVEIDA